MKSPVAVRFQPGKPVAVLLALVAAVSLGILLGYFLKPESDGDAGEPSFERAQVSEVIDGDTVRLEDGRRIRYLGIDAPERDEYYYQEASERNRELVEGKTVELQPGSKDKDEHGRLLRYVYVGGTFVNAELVAGGYAKAYRKGSPERYSQVLFQLEEYAEMNRLGLWGE